VTGGAHDGTADRRANLTASLKLEQRLSTRQLADKPADVTSSTGRLIRRYSVG
jgi:hypothetical protein